MAQNLVNQFISESFQKILQISGSQLADGTGSLVTFLDITASNAVSASFATTASFAENANVDSGSWDGQYSGSNVNVTALLSTFDGVILSNNLIRVRDSLTNNFGSIDSNGFFGQSNGGAVTAIFNTNYSGSLELDNDKGINFAIVLDTTNHNGGDWLIGPAISNELGLQTYPTVIGFDGPGGFGDNRVTFLTPISASAGIIGNLTGNADTATSATTAISSSHALVADTSISSSHALQADSSLTAISSSHAIISDSSLTAITATSSSHALQADSALLANTASYVAGANVDGAVASSFTAVSASFATTASFALNSGVTVDTGSLLVTGSISNATLTFTKGNNTTFDLTVNNVISSSHAVNADTSISSSHAVNSNTSISASHAIISDSSLSAISSSFATNAATASFLLGSIESASYANVAEAFNPGNKTINGNLSVQGSINSNPNNGGGGTAFNASSNGSGSISMNLLNFNGESQPAVFFTGDNSYFQATDNFYIENAPGGVGTGKISIATATDINFTSVDNLGNAIISFSDDFEKAFFDTPISASKGITGSLLGTASFADNALSASHALNADNSISSSHSVTATSSSFATTSISSSFATVAQDLTAGNKIINGNLSVQGSINSNPNNGQGGQAFNATSNGSGSISMNLFNPGFSQPVLFFDGDNSFFQANGNFFIENAPGGQGTGSMNFVTNGNLNFNTPDFNSGVNGGNINFGANSGSINLKTGGDIDIEGKAFHYSTSTNINGFSIQVNELSVVRPDQRAYVETPLIIGPNGTVIVEGGSTLKVISEFS